MNMKKIIGFTDAITECECCGKKELKGTYCLEIDGEELYYGSTCAFKCHGLSIDDQRELRARLAKERKNNALIEKHITPHRVAVAAKIAMYGTDALSLKMIATLERSLSDVTQHLARKYKIAI